MSVTVLIAGFAALVLAAGAAARRRRAKPSPELADTLETPKLPTAER